MIGQVLKDLRVLVCRPEPSASELVQVLRSVGAESESLPCLEISTLSPDAESRQKIMDLDHYAHVIVTSAHAAQVAAELVDQYWPQMPVQQNWYAIGRKTAQALTDTGIPVLDPEGDLSSEDLLQLETLQQVKDTKILLLKGVGGRDTLRDTLSRRGATIDQLALYRRHCPDYSQAELQQALLDFDPEFIVALSAETLTNLIGFAHRAGLDLSNKKLILSSNRVRNIALEQGFQLTYVCANLMPIDIIRTIARARRA